MRRPQDLESTDHGTGAGRRMRRGNQVGIGCETPYGLDGLPLSHLWLSQILI